MNRDDVAIRCAESIAFRSLLKLAPEPKPMDIPPAVDTGGHQGDPRFLTFKEELQVVQSIAFIMSISNSPSHILATAVEQLLPTSSLRVYVAINKRGAHSNNGTIQVVREGLVRLFNLLRGVPDRHGGKSKLSNAHR